MWPRVARGRLQWDLDFERGTVNEPALAMLIEGLARHNGGLCVITTRETVADLARFPDTTSELHLPAVAEPELTATLHQRFQRRRH